MSRHGYMDEIDSPEAQWACIRWAGALKKAIEGKPGQKFLRELLESLDALPEKKLISGELMTPQGEVCALGAVLKHRGEDVSNEAIDCEDFETVAGLVGIRETLAREIMYQNDESWGSDGETPEERRFNFVRKWVVRKIKDEATA